METIKSFIQRAIYLELIPNAPKHGDKDYNYQIKNLECLHELGFNNWLIKNVEELNIENFTENYEKYYTFDNFCKYLNSDYKKTEVQKAILESEKKHYQYIVFNNQTAASHKQNIIPAEILQALEKINCISQNPLKWLKSKSLLAYFVDVINHELNLKHGKNRLIKPFETMLNVSGLVGCINEYKNKTGQYPNGYKDIDEIFKQYKKLK